MTNAIFRGVLSLGVVFLVQAAHAQNNLLGPPVVSSEPVVAFEVARSSLDPIVAPKTDDFSALDPVGQNAGTVLINGELVDPRYFPAILRKKTGNNCTAALIGPATVLTAAHCAAHGAQIGFGILGQRVAGICEQAPGYQAGRKSEDWALCLLQYEVQGIPYENVEIKNPPAQGTAIFLTGYGCTATKAGGKIDVCLPKEMFVPGDQKLRIGMTTVSAQPDQLANRPNSIFSSGSISSGDTILCPGDSGGPAFVIPNANPKAIRRLVGVNSATCILGDHGISAIASTSSAPGVAFIRSWVERHGQIVCGVNGSALPNCAF
jgi:hypothetical protein